MFELKYYINICLLHTLIGNLMKIASTLIGTYLPTLTRILSFMHCIFRQIVILYYLLHRNMNYNIV